jgi:hypothetical protein
MLELIAFVLLSLAATTVQALFQVLTRPDEQDDRWARTPRSQWWRLDK